jgi:hypothetical protein
MKSEKISVFIHPFFEIHKLAADFHSWKNPSTHLDEQSTHPMEQIKSEVLQLQLLDSSHIIDTVREQFQRMLDAADKAADGCIYWMRSFEPSKYPQNFFLDIEKEVISKIQRLCDPDRIAFFPKLANDVDKWRNEDSPIKVYNRALRRNMEAVFNRWEVSHDTQIYTLGEWTSKCIAIYSNTIANTVSDILDSSGKPLVLPPKILARYCSDENFMLHETAQEVREILDSTPQEPPSRFYTPQPVQIVWDYPEADEGAIYRDGDGKKPSLDL